MSYQNETLIRDAVSRDLENIRTLLEEWSTETNNDHIETSEVDLVVSDVSRFTSNDLRFGRVYRVAEDIDGNLLGLMGMCAASDILSPLAPSVTRGNAGELISAFVSSKARGHGIGRLLVASLEEEAMNRKFEDMLVVSGSRFRETGWPFWQSLYGEPVEVSDHSAVWLKHLTDEK